MKSDPLISQTEKAKALGGILSSRELQIKYKTTCDLRPDPSNPRIHNGKQIQQIANSIRAFGFNVPVLVDPNGRIVCGHGRLEAAKLLGILAVPTICLSHLLAHQVRAFMIADNKLTENSEWNEKLLGEIFIELSALELDFNLEDTGFEMGEIDTHIENLSSNRGDEPDPADDIPEIRNEVAVCKAGDLWLLGRHRVLCGNALDEHDYLFLMEDKRAAMIFSDPPYNVRIGEVTGLGSIKHRDFQMASGEMTEDQFIDFLSRSFKLFLSNSVDGSLHFVFIDWRHMRELLEAGKRHYSELKNVCVWVKSNAGMGSLYRSQHEFIAVFKNGEHSHQNNVQLGQYGRYRTNVWNYPGANSFSRTTEEGNLLALHPTVKPVALVGDAIMDCSARGDIVLDPFLGSGTTVIAAERTGRICYGMEIDPCYADTAIRRWQQFTGLEAKHGNTGRLFNEAEKEAVNEP